MHLDETAYTTISGFGGEPQNGLWISAPNATFTTTTDSPGLFGSGYTQANYYEEPLTSWPVNDPNVYPGTIGTIATRRICYESIKQVATGLGGRKR